MGSRRRALTLALCLAPGLWPLGQGAYIHAKALLAQQLLERAWGRIVAGETEARPWPWADTWPLARLETPGGESMIVLAGASGRTLAFGPGHVTGTALPGRPGHSLVSGHRDTHFRFLRDLRVGDPLWAQTPEGLRRRYRVTELGVVDTRRARVLDDPVTERLTLVTCYPFDAAQPGGPLRYVVSSVAENPNPAVGHAAEPGPLEFFAQRRYSSTTISIVLVS